MELRRGDVPLARRGEATRLAHGDVVLGLLSVGSGGRFHSPRALAKLGVLRRGQCRRRKGNGVLGQAERADAGRRKGGCDPSRCGRDKQARGRAGCSRGRKLAAAAGAPAAGRGESSDARRGEVR